METDASLSTSLGQDQIQTFLRDAEMRLRGSVLKGTLLNTGASSKNVDGTQPIR